MSKGLIGKVSELISLKLPFFLLRKAGEKQVLLLAQDNQELYHKPHENLPSAIMQPFDPGQPPVYIHGHQQLFFDWDFSEIGDTYDSLQQYHDPLVAQTYQQLVAQAVEDLQKGKMKKVVLSRKQNIPTALSMEELLNALLNTYPKAQCYCFYHPVEDVWMGATPETLMTVQGTTVQTMSLAGTAIYKEGVEQVWGEKEKEEQQLVTDDIVERLERHGVQDIQVDGPFTSRAGNLIHLKSMIVGRADLETIMQIPAALHPTPAVCGLPREEAFHYIQQHESYGRSYYTGYLGVMDPTQEKADFYVNLRCLRWRPGMAEVFVGGGITARSVPQHEYDETLNKLGTMVKILQ
ncbi:chorismate-binding protein [Nonlabens xiamenensis]|uniref:chorismate-binding protein n=1 Tax=Nonlabens xiamenensis TaxID=2341043 RepID=UPI000F60B34C|nr:chorismate-binding protein [Nonlabens xiamenensis]